MTVQLIKWSYLRKERAASNCAGDHITHTKRRNSHHTTCRQSKMLSLPVYLSNQSGQKRKKTWRTGGHIRLLLPALQCRSSAANCLTSHLHFLHRSHSTYIHKYIHTYMFIQCHDIVNLAEGLVLLHKPSRLALQSMVRQGGGETSVHL